VTTAITRHEASDELKWPAWLGSRPLLDWSRLPAFMNDFEFKVEEYTEDGHVVVRAELPGIDPERDVQITINDHVLEIRAERRQEEHEELKQGYRSEFRYGSFNRSFRLPKEATESDVAASYEDGILEVKIPLGEQAEEPRRIAVTRS
jgi:HSP20 family protein